MFEQYKEYLTGDIPPDFWSDDGIGIACEMLGTFAADDWNALSEHWATAPKYWRVRCAEALDTDLSREGAAILLSMLRDPSSDVVVAAIDSLRSWPQLPAQSADLDVERLASIREDAGLVDRVVLDEFLSRAFKEANN